VVEADSDRIIRTHFVDRFILCLVSPVRMVRVAAFFSRATKLMDGTELTRYVNVSVMQEKATSMPFITLGSVTLQDGMRHMKSEALPSHPVQELERQVQYYHWMNLAVWSPSSLPVCQKIRPNVLNAFYQKC
jgi:hypothetical protein